MLIGMRSARYRAAGDAALIGAVGISDPQLEGTGVIVVAVALRPADHRRIETRESDLIACGRIRDIRALCDEADVAVVHAGGVTGRSGGEQCECSTADDWFCFHVGGSSCCLLFVVCCLLFVVCCLLFVVCCLLFVVCCLLFVVRCLLSSSSSAPSPTLPPLCKGESRAGVASRSAHKEAKVNPLPRTRWSGI